MCLPQVPARSPPAASVARAPAAVIDDRVCGDVVDAHTTPHDVPLAPEEVSQLPTLAIFEPTSPEQRPVVSPPLPPHAFYSTELYMHKNSNGGMCKILSNFGHLAHSYQN